MSETTVYRYICLSSRTQIRARQFTSRYDILFGLRNNQSVLCLEERRQILIYSLWFHLARVCSHILPHWRLHHRCGLCYWYVYIFHHVCLYIYILYHNWSVYFKIVRPLVYKYWYEWNIVERGIKHPYS